MLSDEIMKSHLFALKAVIYILHSVYCSNILFCFQTETYLYGYLYQYIMQSNESPKLSFRNVKLKKNHS